MYYQLGEFVFGLVEVFFFPLEMFFLQKKKTQNSPPYSEMCMRQCND